MTMKTTLGKTPCRIPMGQLVAMTTTIRRTMTRRVLVLYPKRQEKLNNLVRKLKMDHLVKTKSRRSSQRKMKKRKRKRKVGLCI